MNVDQSGVFVCGYSGLRSEILFSMHNVTILFIKILYFFISQDFYKIFQAETIVQRGIKYFRLRKWLSSSLYGLVFFSFHQS